MIQTKRIYMSFESENRLIVYCIKHLNTDLPWKISHEKCSRTVMLCTKFCICCLRLLLKVYRYCLYEPANFTVKDKIF